MLAAMTISTLLPTTWKSLAWLRVFLCRSRVRNAARSFLARCPSRSLSVSSLSKPRSSAIHGSLGVVHPAMQRVSATHLYRRLKKAASGTKRAERRRRPVERGSSLDPSSNSELARGPASCQNIKVHCAAHTHHAALLGCAARLLHLRAEFRARAACACPTAEPRCGDAARRTYSHGVLGLR